MGTSKVPVIIPADNAELMHGNAELSFLRIIKEYSSMGKNISFICSQTDSLTGNIKPAKKLLPVHSYIKWKTAPVIMAKRIPIIVYVLNCLIYITS